VTTLTNVQVVAELGWTMQIISDNNDGRVPRFWRPPFGDVDNRVRAIAKGVFGLETVIWNQDTGDWNLDQPGSTYTQDSIVAQYTKWLSDKSHGLNVLEHEVRPSQIEVFKIIFPRAQQMGWQVGNVADMWGKPWYQNAATGNGTVTPMSVGGAAASMASASASGSASASNSSTSASASSASSANATSSAISTAPASASISSSVASAISTQNAAASPSASRISGAGMGVVLSRWGWAIPALGLFAVL
jgi:chitin deacetylase